ncbi:MAG: hypothetical protein GX455_11765 [Phycisphaerae bacterium]|nr:hypothetical protein [Phycisphaerae bacterium]
MKRMCFPLGVMVCLSFFSSLALGYSGGTGMPDSPYEIATPADLIQLGNTPDDYAKHFKLTANIDLAEQGPMGDGSWSQAVIASGTEFSGSFNGNGFTIRNLTINSQGQDYSYLGLFGALGVGSVVENLALENVTIISGWDSEFIGGLCGRSNGWIAGCSVDNADVIGKYYVGGLCGHNETGTIVHSFTTGLVQGQSTTGGLVGGNGEYAITEGVIQFCFSTATVIFKTGSSYKVGGLCGENWGTVSQSYATGAVTGQYYFGGLCGGNYGTIVDCYASGSVEGDYSGGGLCGHNDRGKIIRCYSTGLITVSDQAGGLCGSANTDGTYGDHGVTYEDTRNFWDVESSGTGASAMGTGISHAQLLTQSTFTDVGWDFSEYDGNPAVWKWVPTLAVPLILDWQPIVNEYSGGDGSEQTPWKIAKVEDLILMSSSPDDWDKHFILVNDIDLAGCVFDKAVIAPDADGSDWEFQGTPFTGSFDGQGNTIRNLTLYNSDGGDYLGLFGHAQDANIGSVILKDLLIDTVGNDSMNIGGLIGKQLRGVTQHCSVSGTIHAGIYDDLGSQNAWKVGGLIGHCEADYWEFLAVVRCSSSAEVHGILYVGGLVGTQSNCTIRECHSSGSAEGEQYTGGLVGMGFGLIERCFTTAAVRNFYAGSYLGGLAGHQGGIIYDSFARSTVYVHSGSTHVGGFAGSCFGVSRCYSASTITLVNFVMDYVADFVGHPQGVVTSSFFDSDISGWGNDSSGATGLTTAEMQTAATFIDAGWDFDPESVDGTPAAWEVVGVHYPSLVWYAASQGQYGGGKGTPEDPYKIATVDDLLRMSATPTDWDKYFILVADLNLVENPFDKAPIAPDTDDVNDEFQGIPFSGTFEGNGHAIRNLTISNSGGSDYLGLFGYLNNATIKNLRIENAQIVASGLMSINVGAAAGFMIDSLVSGCLVSGVVSADLSDLSSSHVGGLVGYAESESLPGIISFEDCVSFAQVEGAAFVGGLVGLQGVCNIERCRADGLVTGWQSVGGMVGMNMNGSMDQCSSTASVLAIDSNNYAGGMAGLFFGTLTDSYVAGSLILGNDRLYSGGLVGANYGAIARCYSVCLIERGSINGSVGGLVGNNSGMVTDSFWDIWVSGLSDSAAGIGLGTDEMMLKSTFINAGWDYDPVSIDGTPVVWKIQEGIDYPRLATFKYGSGNGTPGNPYTINSVEELILLSDSPDDWDKHFILMADLDLSGYTFDRAVIAPDNVPSSQVTSFDGTRFTGSFNGNGHTISNLTIRTENGGDYLGLFGCIQNAAIKNLRMENVSITALGKSNSIGAVVGQTMNSQLSLCVVSGSIAAGEFSPETTLTNVGGLVGKQLYGLIESCASLVNISSGDEGFLLGGIVGWLTEGTIRHALAAGTIEGGLKTQHVGGLAGQVSIIEGNVNPATAIIENSCAHGSIVVGQNSYSLGGLVGSLYIPCELRNSYSAVRLSYTGIFGVSFGGLTGYAGGPVTNCFWDKEINRMGIDGDTGLDTAEMTQKSTFTDAGWDFSDNDGDPADWRIRDGEDYPRLVWQPITPGDVAGDPDVDVTDLITVVDQWMQSCPGCPADLNGDGLVNLEDIDIICVYWLIGPIGIPVN